jgi:hypothetical protein
MYSTLHHKNIPTSVQLGHVILLMIIFKDLPGSIIGHVMLAFFVDKAEMKQFLSKRFMFPFRYLAQHLILINRRIYPDKTACFLQYA